MAVAENPLDCISFVSRSETRVTVLEQLLDGNAVERSTLTERVDASQSTITRTLADLEDRGLVESAGQRYRLTPVGEIIVTEFLNLVEYVSVTAELSEFLNWFPYDDYDINPLELREAEVTVGTEAEPYAPVRDHARALESASTYRALLPSLIRQGKENLHERVVDGDLTLEFVVSPPVAERMTDGDFAATFREQLASDNAAVHVAESTPSFFLGLLDDELVQIGVADDNGLPRAVLQTTRPSVYDWATAVYDDHRAEATPMSLSEFE